MVPFIDKSLSHQLKNFCLLEGQRRQSGSRQRLGKDFDR